MPARHSEHEASLAHGAGSPFPRRAVHCIGDAAHCNAVVPVRRRRQDGAMLKLTAAVLGLAITAAPAAPQTPPTGQRFFTLQYVARLRLAAAQSARSRRVDARSSGISAATWCRRRPPARIRPAAQKQGGEPRATSSIGSRHIGRETWTASPGSWPLTRSSRIRHFVSASRRARRHPHLGGRDAFRIERRDHRRALDGG